MNKRQLKKQLTKRIKLFESTKAEPSNLPANTFMGYVVRIVQDALFQKAMQDKRILKTLTDARRRTVGYTI